MRSHTHDHVSRSLIYFYWIVHQEYRNERKKPSMTLLQVKTNLTTSAKLTKTILFDRKFFSKKQPKKRVHFDQTSPKKRNRQQQKNPATQRKKQPNCACGKTAQLATLADCSTSNVHFQHHVCFVTAVLWSILHPSYSSKTVMRLDYQILLISLPP